MKEPHSISSSPDKMFTVNGLTYGANGPYDLQCTVECVGIIGDSGIGKTLFLRALADLDEHGGAIALNGRDCSSYPAPEWRTLVAMVPAESRWWHQNVGRHLPDKVDTEKVEGLLGALGFAPDVLDWQVSRLSTGEKQRLALVRALVRMPSVLLLDETGSGLDSRNTILLEDVVLKYQVDNQVVVLWVSHNHEQINRVCDRLVILERNGLEIKDISSKKTQRERRT